MSNTDGTDGTVYRLVAPRKNKEGNGTPQPTKDEKNHPPTHKNNEVLLSIILLVLVFICPIMVVWGISLLAKAEIFLSIIL